MQTRIVSLALFQALLVLPSNPVWAGQSNNPESALPDVPQPQPPTQTGTSTAGPCQVRRAGAAMAGTAASKAAAASGAYNSDPEAELGSAVQLAPCPPLLPIINWYARFLNGPQVKPQTPKEKAWLAVSNVVDPFNVITILGDAGISVGSDAHSAYGPGMRGFGRYVGVSFTQNITGEFFGTFVIPSVVHQDPHYHRMPEATIPRRIAHAIAQVVWTQGDNGKGMVNYANLVGYAIDDAIGNLYVPGRETNIEADVSRYSIGLATAPIDNFVSEFLPDLARHIHVQVVVIQRVINQVAKADAAGSP
jgi:hypothetical protein